jgi:two-component system sensor histidine kinase AlgZ
VQCVLALCALSQAAHWMQTLTLIGPPMLGGLFGTLVWLMSVCAGKRALARAPVALRWTCMLLLGAVCGGLGWGLLRPFGLADLQAPHWTAVPLAGALLSATLWTWLDLRMRARVPAEAAARLAELQARIRPHFLFNALNTAVALVRVDPLRAEEVLEDLAQLFRVALEDHGAAVTLADEVELAQRYLAIEQMRFGERLRVTWQLDPAASGARVPPLLLQPLVENAVRHGVEPSPHGADIVVRTRVKRGQAVISIVNTLSGQPSRPGHGMALRNVRERLRLLHDVTAQFQARRQSDRFHVHIEVPL